MMMRSRECRTGVDITLEGGACPRLIHAKCYGAVEAMNRLFGNSSGKKAAPSLQDAIVSVGGLRKQLVALPFMRGMPRPMLVSARSRLRSRSLTESSHGTRNRWQSSGMDRARCVCPRPVLCDS